MGSSHAMTERHVLLDLELIRPCTLACQCRWCCTARPGFPIRSWSERSSAGMTKINIATHLNAVFTDSVRATLAGNPSWSTAADISDRPATRSASRRRGCSGCLAACDHGVPVQRLLALGRVVHDRLRIAVRNAVRASPRLVQVLDRHIGQFGDVAPDVAAVRVELLAPGWWG